VQPSGKSRTVSWWLHNVKRLGSFHAAKKQRKSGTITKQ